MSNCKDCKFSKFGELNDENFGRCFNSRIDVTDGSKKFVLAVVKWIKRDFGCILFEKRELTSE